RVLEAWGFTYKTNMVWDKGQHYAGFYVLGEHELLLLATRGSFLPACKPHSVIRSRRTQHSSKPNMYEVIETMYPGQRYIELFARNNAPRQGWTFWRLEANVEGVALWKQRIAANWQGSRAHGGKLVCLTMPALDRRQQPCELSPT